MIECPICHEELTDLDLAGVTAEIRYTSGDEPCHADCLRN